MKLQVENSLTDLCVLAKKCGTDKVQHGYTKYYSQIFKKDRTNPINFCELGIFRGASIGLWHEYFTKGNIYCIDNCKPEKCSGRLICPSDVVQKLNQYSPRIHAYYSAQDDEEKLNTIFKGIEFDYICDDASHFQRETLKSLGILFKKLKSGGTYIIEDICCMWAFQTGSWWGQKNGKEDTNAGNNTWIKKFEETGKLKDVKLFNDTIYSVIDNYIKTNIFKSEYLTKEENQYLTDNIKHIEMISAPQQRSKEIHDLGVPKWAGTPNSKLKTGTIAIIVKK